MLRLLCIMHCSHLLLPSQDFCPYLSSVHINIMDAKDCHTATICGYSSMPQGHSGETRPCGRHRMCATPCVGCTVIAVAVRKGKKKSETLNCALDAIVTSYDA